MRKISFMKIDLPKSTSKAKWIQDVLIENNNHKGVLPMETTCEPKPIFSDTSIHRLLRRGCAC